MIAKTEPQPSPGAQQLWQTYLLDVCACREELQQPVFAAIDVLEFPELHDESIPFMAFTKCLTRLMGAAGVKDFSLQV
jgi:hypothetical protein